MNEKIDYYDWVNDTEWERLEKQSYLKDIAVIHEELRKSRIDAAELQKINELEYNDDDYCPN